MPILEDGQEPSGVRIAASAPLELMWLLHDCGVKHELVGPFVTLERMRTELGPLITSFWPDGVRGFTEAMVLAQRSGTMLDMDLTGFFAGLDKATQAPPDTRASLRCELPHEREAILARLERLATDARLRERYRSLLQTVWESARAEWESQGRQAATRTVADWSRRLNGGADYHELLGRPRLWPGRPELEVLADTALAEGRLILSPGWYFGHIHIVDLDGTVFLGGGIRSGVEALAQKEIASKVAGKLKALADPTRVGILLWLGCQQASVTEIAGHFKLSQPTVSQHIQVLREAGLIAEKAVGRSAMLSVSEERLKEFFSGVEESLLGWFWSDAQASTSGSRRRQRPPGPDA